MNIHFKSESNEWRTPQDLFDKLDRKFNFTLDPCATKNNAKCERFYTKKEDGLIQDWSDEIVFMNPPYGREIKKWVKKAYLESLKGVIIVCLIPARTDTIYWHNYIFNKAKIKFLKGRLKFSDSKYSAPFPSAIVIYNSDIDIKEVL